MTEGGDFKQTIYSAQNEERLTSNKFHVIIASYSLT